MYVYALLLRTRFGRLRFMRTQMGRAVMGRAVNNVVLRVCIETSLNPVECTVSSTTT